MKIVKRDRDDAGCCNFHTGLKLNGNFINFDHDEVYEVSSGKSGGIVVRFCKKCLEKLFGETIMKEIE